MKKGEEFFADYLEGKRNEKELTSYFFENPGAQEEFEELKRLFAELPEEQTPEVSNDADQQFYGFLKAQKKPRFRAVFPEIMRYAALLLAVGGAYYFGSRKAHKEIVTVEKPVYITVRDTITLKEEMVAHEAIPRQPVVMKELADIKKEVNQINDVQHKMILAMLRQESAASRLEAINYSYNLQATDGTLMEALVKVLERDPSVNVRLAALEAVGRFELNPMIRESLVFNLAEQQDPALQLALITKLTELRELKALPVFAEIMNDPNVPENIRNRAELGMQIINM